MIRMCHSFGINPLSIIVELNVPASNYIYPCNMFHFKQQKSRTNFFIKLEMTAHNPMAPKVEITQEHAGVKLFDLYKKEERINEEKENYNLRLPSSSF